jgi:polysaccharide biosynthesis/export protein
MPPALLQREPIAIFAASTEAGWESSARYVGSDAISIDESFFVRVIMAAKKISLLVWLLIGSTASLGLCEPSLAEPASIGKSVADTMSSAVPESPSERAAAQAYNHSAASAHMMDKLSNAVTSEYIIGAEDVLEITVWRNVDLSKIAQVRPDGKISMPIIRDIIAVGKTPSQLAEEITSKLKEYVQTPVVAVSVKEVNSSNIFVLGEVKTPGRYPLKSKTTLLQGITIAGGFTPIAARNQMVIFRFTESSAGIKRLTASYDDIVLSGVITENVELKSGDTVVVPSESMVIFPGR